MGVSTTKATSKEALEEILSLGIPAYVFHTPNKSVIYHPKVYLFKGVEEFRLITGSSNLTTTGLYQNVEASVVIDSSIEEGETILSDAETFFSKFISDSDNNLFIVVIILQLILLQRKRYLDIH